MKTFTYCELAICLKFSFYSFIFTFADFRYDSVFSKLLYSAKLSSTECKLCLKRISIQLLKLDSTLSNTEKWSKMQNILSLAPVNYDLLQFIFQTHKWMTFEQTKWLYELFARMIGSDSVELWIDYKKFLIDNGEIMPANLTNDRAMRQLDNNLVPAYLQLCSLN